MVLPTSLSLVVYLVGSETSGTRTIHHSLVNYSVARYVFQPGLGLYYHLHSQCLDTQHRCHHMGLTTSL